MQLITTDVSLQSNALVLQLLNKLVGLKKPRKYFIIHIMKLFLSMRGLYTFQGRSRYGYKHEKSNRLQFEQSFDYLSFNIDLCRDQLSSHLVMAFDLSHLPKSGKHTPNLGHRSSGKFWSGCLGKAVKGLEIGGLAVIDMEHYTVFKLEAVLRADAKE